MLLPTGRVGGESVAWSGYEGPRALGLALRSGAVDEVGGFRLARRAWAIGLLSGPGRVVALRRLRARGLRPGDGPNGLRESGHMVTFGLDDASRGDQA